MSRGAGPGAWRLARPVGALVEAMRRFGAKAGWVLSSHVAMSMMLSLFPFILFVVALAGFLSGKVAIRGIVPREQAVAEMVALVFGAWPDTIEDPIVAELNAVLAADNIRLMTLGGLLVLYFASNGVDAVREAMTRAYHDIDTRPFWRTRLLCLGFAAVGAVAVVFVATVEVALPLFAALAIEAVPWTLPGWLSADGVGRGLVSAMPALAVLSAHLWLPGRRHSLRQILPGVVLTIVLWTVMSWGFARYVLWFGAYSTTYAGLAGAMAALIYLYMISAILILGAEFNGALIDMSAATATKGGAADAPGEGRGA